MHTDNILVIGACGQIGAELTLALRKIFGNDRVIATDVKDEADLLKNTGPFFKLDVLDKGALLDIVSKNKITQVYLLAAILSATGEKKPALAWQINMESLLNILNLAKDKKIQKVYWPSSIAVFGPTSPKENCPQKTIIEPATVYGISKYAGEMWCEYYFNKYAVDVRSIRYPGLISHQAAPGGGTTDYAVEIYYEALKHKHYTCFLNSDTYLPMMYMPDAIRATIELMGAPASKIENRMGYNISAMSFSPEEIASEIKKHIPDFKIAYQPDFRQTIASSWPKSINDAQAREHWGWKEEFNLEKMTSDMLDAIRSK